MKKLSLILIVLLFLTPFSYSKVLKLNVYVQRVIDGDTIVVLYHRLPVYVRFAHIDAYEAEKNRHIKKQEKITELPAQAIIQLGQKATNFVKQKVNHKYICIEFNTKHLRGDYGRYLGIVYTLPCEDVDNKTESLNDMLLNKKLAIPYRR